MIVGDKLIMNLTRITRLGFCQNLTTCQRCQLSLVAGTMIMLHISNLCPCIQRLVRYFDGKTKWEGKKGHIFSHLLVYRDLIFKILSEARSLRNAKLQIIMWWDCFKIHSIAYSPQGDSYTRRLIFDSNLEGCILVFFPTRHNLCTI